MADAEDFATSTAALIVREGASAENGWVREVARARLGSERQASLERGLFEVTDFPRRRHKPEIPPDAHDEIEYRRVV